MTLGIIIAILLLGVLLLLVEIIFVPGTTVVGVGGFILLSIGIFLAYKLSTSVGNIALAASFTALFLSLVVMLKGKTWKRMALETNVEGKSVEQPEKLVELGDRGKSIGRLNPSGKALFNEHILEVTTSGEFIDAGTDIEVIKVEQNKIRIKSI